MTTLFVYGPGFWSETLPEYWQDISKIELPLHIQSAYDEGDVDTVEAYIHELVEEEGRRFVKTISALKD